MARSPSVIGFRLVYWNANGIRHKMSELRVFAAQHAPDAILVQETFLRSGEKVSIPGYIFYGTARRTSAAAGNKVAGGTAIFVKSSVQHHRLSIPVLRAMEATAITLTGARGSLTLVSTYVPVKHNPFFTLDMENLLTIGNPILFAGDFNAHSRKWNCSGTNRNGKALQSFADFVGLKIRAPAEPTHPAPGGGSIIDLVVTRDFPYACNLRTMVDLSSDHFPVMFETMFQIERDPPFFRPNWERFTTAMEREPFEAPAPDSLEELDRCVERITNSMNKNFKETGRMVKATQNSTLARNLRGLLRDKNAARKEYQRTGCPEDRTRMNRLQAHFRRAVKQFEEAAWKERMELLDTESGSLWTEVKRRKRMGLNQAGIPPLKTPNGIVFTNAAKAEALADSLELQFKENNNGFPDKEAKVIQDVETFLRTEDASEIPPVLPSEVMEYITKTKPKKSPGEDEISNRMLKRLPLKTIFLITMLINAVFRLKIFPTAWKTAVVVPLHKPGKHPCAPVSYRPISLLSVLAKMTESLLVKRMMPMIDSVMMHEQFGFRPKLSTQHQLLRVIELAHDGFCTKKSTGAVLLDVAKAFDRVWIPGLQHKLIKAGFPAAFVKIINSYLTGRTFRVRVRRELSSQRPIEAGTPQGSVLGPHLFNLYMNDIPRAPGVALALFADDTAVLTQAKELTDVRKRLADYLLSLENWIREWKVAINVDKTQAIIFTNKRNFPPPLVMNGTVIPWSKDVLYLGVILDQRLAFHKHVDRVKNKLTGITTQIYPLIAPSSHLSPEMKLLIWKTVLRPIVSYACCVWGYACKTTIGKLEAAQMRVLRTITKALWFYRNRDILRDVGLPCLKDYFARLAVKFFDGVEQHENESVQSIHAYDPRFHRYRKRPRAILNEVLYATTA